MDSEDRELLLTSAWIFARHGRGARARALCEALVGADPRDGVAAAALAQLQLEDGEAEAALRTVRAAEFPAELNRAAALLETRALQMLGRTEEAARRWRRQLATQHRQRTWVES